MASLATPPAARSRLNDWFDGLFEVGQDGTVGVKTFTDAQAEDLRRIERAMDESNKFRVGTASTLERLDRHLNEYRHTCILWFAQQGDLDRLSSQDVHSGDNDHLFFPEDRQQLFRLVAFYLTVMTYKLKPRSPADLRPRLTAITNRRVSLIQWMKTMMENPPGYHTVAAKTNKALFYAVEKYGVNTKRREKQYFGRHELRHLMDFDMSDTQAFDVAESHHLAWILSYITGVRPGAIGRSTHRPESYLRWRDVKITRDMQSNRQFTLEVTFPYMKGFQQNRSRPEACENEGYLRLTILPPLNPDNIPFSPTYRLLAIALKRRLLLQYDTFGELLNGEHAYVQIKPDHQDDPIFFATGPRGLSLDATKAASSHSFGQYLKKRAVEAGYIDATMYAFRRKAGTNVDRAAGREAARAFMHHDPNSRVFEKSYEQTNFDLDIFAIAVGEEQRSLIVDLKTPTLYRAELRMDEKQKAEMIDEYVRLHVDPDVHGDRATLDRRRLRREARKALREQAREIHEGEFTKAELDQRVAEMQAPSAFVQALTKRALNRTNDQVTDKADDTVEPADLELDDDNDDDGSGSNLDLEESLDIRFSDTVDDEEEELNSASIDTDSETSPLSKVTRPAAPQILQPEHDAANFDANCATSSAWAGKDRLFETFAYQDQKRWLDLLESYRDAVLPKTRISSIKWQEKIPRILLRLEKMKHAESEDEGRPTKALEVSTDLPDEEEPLLTVPYDLMLSSFFEVMLESDSSSLKSGAKRQCPECLGDETITKDKYRLYRSKSDLQRHLESAIHCPFSRWRRKAALVQDDDPQGVARCVYGGCGRVYEEVSGLQVHLERLVEKKITEEDTHYHDMREAGWFDDNFKKSRRSAMSWRIQASREKQAKALGRRRSPGPEEVAEQRPAKWTKWSKTETSKYTVVGPMPNEADCFAGEFTVWPRLEDLGMSLGHAWDFGGEIERVKKQWEDAGKDENIRWTGKPEPSQH